MSSTSLILGGIFSAIGAAALFYGKKQSRMKPMLIGIGLLVYPFFITDTVMLAVIGGLLTAALFIFRD